MSRPSNDDETRELGTPEDVNRLGSGEPAEREGAAADPAMEHPSTWDLGMAAGFGLSAPTELRPPADPPNEVGMLIGDKYKLLQAIGEGGMGSVWLAEQKERVKRTA